MKYSALFAGLLCLALLLTACVGGPVRPAADPAAETPALAAEPSARASEAAASEQATESEAETLTQDPTEAAPATEHAPQQNAGGESIAFSGVFYGLDETVFGLIYNDPFSNGDPIPTEIWNEGKYDKLVIIPRYIGSKVSAYALRWDDDGQMQLAAEPTYTAVAEDGCVIGASLLRPEGAPAWYVSIELPNGQRAGMALGYNGRYGTPLYEFLTQPEASTLLTASNEAEDWSMSMDSVGPDLFWAFWRAAQRLHQDTWGAAQTYFTAMTELGDGAAWTVVEEDDMYDGVCSLQVARLHQAYCTGEGTLAQQTAAQYALYREIGNELGILGPDAVTDGAELTYRLTGLTVYNPSLCATSVEVTVDGTVVGLFDLSRSDFCTLLPLELPARTADRPVSVQVRVLETSYGLPANAIVQVYPGLASNISRAI